MNMDLVKAAKVLALPTKLFLIHPERRKATVLVLDSQKSAGQILSEELARVEKAYAKQVMELTLQIEQLRKGRLGDPLNDALIQLCPGAKS